MVKLSDISSKNRSWAYRVINRLRKTIRIDKRRFTALEVLDMNDPFRLLIATILSQNTNDRNSMRAFIELDMRIGVDPNSLVRASEEAIIESIRVAGLYKNKARAIKELSRMMIERYDGDLMKILEMPLDRAREELLSMPNVGEKTADIILLFIARRPVFPVDTHIFRVSIRLGLADRRDYSKVSGIWRVLLEPCDYMEAHHLLIGLGREICKPKKPECHRCPISDLCDYYLNLYKSKRYFSSQ